MTYFLLKIDIGVAVTCTYTKLFKHVPIHARLDVDFMANLYLKSPRVTVLIPTGNRYSRDAYVRLVSRAREIIAGDTEEGVGSVSNGHLHLN